MGEGGTSLLTTEVATVVSGFAADIMPTVLELIGIIVLVGLFKADLTIIFCIGLVTTATTASARWTLKDSLKGIIIIAKMDKKIIIFFIIHRLYKEKQGRNLSNPAYQKN